jgi:hypothetical protein
VLLSDADTKVVETSVTTAGKVVEGVVMGFWLEVVVGTVEVVLELVLELLELLVLEAEEEEEAELAADDDEEVGVVDEVGVVVGIGNIGVVDDDVLDVDGVLKLKI